MAWGGELRCIRPERNTSCHSPPPWRNCTAKITLPASVSSQMPITARNRLNFPGGRRKIASPKSRGPLFFPDTTSALSDNGFRPDTAGPQIRLITLESTVGKYFRRRQIAQIHCPRRHWGLIWNRPESFVPPPLSAASYSQMSRLYRRPSACAAKSIKDPGIIRSTPCRGCALSSCKPTPGSPGYILRPPKTTCVACRSKGLPASATATSIFCSGVDKES